MKSVTPFFCVDIIYIIYINVKDCKYHEKLAGKTTLTRGGSRAATTSKMKRCVIIVNG